MKLDLWLLDKLDRLTTKAQKRGYLLTSIHVHVAGVALASNVLNPVLTGNKWLIPFAGLVWGVNLFFRQRWAGLNKDYPSSVRMVERLNAKALESRETDTPYRYMWIALIVMLVPSMILDGIGGEYIKAITEFVAIISASLVTFIEGCFFIGPGEFAKQTQSQDVKNAVHISI